MANGSALLFRDAVQEDAPALNRLQNDVIRETFSSDSDVERPVSETAFYLQCMLKNDYPCLLVFGGDQLAAFGALEHWDPAAGGFKPPLSDEITKDFKNSWRY